MHQNMFIASCALLIVLAFMPQAIAKTETDFKQVEELQTIKNIENEIKILYEKTINEKEKASVFAEKSANKYESFQSVLSLSLNIVGCATVIILFLCGIIGHYYKKEIRNNFLSIKNSSSEITTLNDKINNQKQLVSRIEAIIESSNSLREQVGQDMSEVAMQLRGQGVLEIFSFLPAAILAYNENSPDAELLWRIVCRAEPDNASWHMLYGIVLSNHGKQAEAIAAFDASLKINPVNEKCHNVRACAFEECEATDEESLKRLIDQIDLSITSFPRYAARYRIAKIITLRNGNKIGEMINVCNEHIDLVKNNPESANTFFHLLMQFANDSNIPSYERDKIDEIAMKIGDSKGEQ